MVHVSRRFGIVAVIMSMSIFGSFFLTTDASAGREVNSRLNYGNAGAYCGGGGIKGMVWISNDNSDYFSEKVTVAANATSVKVQVRGATNSCSVPPQASAMDTYASGVRSENGNLSISGSEFFRGTLPRYTAYAWSSGTRPAFPGHGRNSTNYLNATLNVNGVARCTGNGPVSGSVSVGIYRYLSLQQYGSRFDRGDGVEWINVGFTRDCPRINWSVSPSVSVNRTTAAPGQTITWTHTVKNNGPTATNKTVNYRYQNSNGLGTGQGSNHSFASGKAVNATASFTSTHTVTQNDVGKTLCRSTEATPRSHNNSGVIASGSACVTVPYNWSVSASVTPTSGTGGRVTPGQSLGYDWYVRNNGPTKTNKQVNYVVKVVRYSNGSSTTPPSNAQLAGATALTNTAGAARQWSSSRPSGWGVGSGDQAARPDDSLLRYTLTQNDVERWICAVVYASPRTHSDNGRVYGSTCRYIPLDYALVPKVTNINDNAILDISKTSFAVEGQVTNGGPTRSAPNIAWQMTQLVYGPSVTINNKGGGTGANDPCAYFTGEISCAAIGGGTDASAYNDGTARDKNGTANVTPDTYELGTRVCFVLSVKPHADGSSDWRYSPMVCQIAGKRPLVQVRGGDLLVGRGLDASGNKIRSVVATSVTAARVNGTTRNYGSWSEYGILASGGVTRMASGSGYAGGVGTQSLCNGLSLLTFYNRTSSGSCSNSQIGSYSIASASPAAAIAAKFTPNGAAVSGDVNITSLAASSASAGQVRSASGNVNIRTGGVIPPGKWVVIKAPGRTVTISDNINYSNAPITSIDRIPQVVIIAQNILIDENVTNVDAWLIATGTIRTCDQVTSANALRSTNCTNPLRVNGPVVTNRLELWRTAGAGAGEAAGDPAEVFNLRPDAYLWATATQIGVSKVQTASTRELPPRF